MKGQCKITESLNSPTNSVVDVRERRINYLDALKCLGIILVIEGHVRQLGMGVRVYDTLSGLMLYSFNMPLFFFVSGLLAYKKNVGVMDIVRKLKQKFVFLVIPAVIFKFIAVR